MVSKQKGWQEHRIDVGKRVLNTLVAIISGSDIVFSSRYNGLYGPDEFVAILAEMCRSGITANEAVRVFDDRTNMPAAGRFRDRMKTTSPEGVRHIYERMMIKTVSVAKKGGLACRGPIMAAIDRHMIPRHDGGGMPYPVYPRFKDGAGRFE